MFQIHAYDSDLSSDIFDQILKVADKPSTKGAWVEPSPAVAFLPQGSANRYGVYKGTLTFPPCTRNVNWLISEDNYRISQAQIDILKQVKDDLGQPILSNVRDVQYVK